MSIKKATQEKFRNSSMFHQEKELVKWHTKQIFVLWKGSMKISVGGYWQKSYIYILKCKLAKKGLEGFSVCFSITIFNTNGSVFRLNGKRYILWEKKLKCL